MLLGIFFVHLFCSLLLLRLDPTFVEVPLFAWLVGLVLCIAFSVLLLIVAFPRFLFSIVAKLTRIDVLFLVVV